MTRIRPLLLALSLCALGAVSSGTAAASPVVQPGSEITLRTAAGASAGTAVLTDSGSQTHVRVRATGLAPGFHGFHVHSVGQCDGTTATAFSSAGGHWNPDSAAHGGHDGDMPPLYADANGVATADFVTDAFRLADLADADGAALMVHAGPDNLGNIPARYTFTNTDGSTGTGADTTTKATGDSGARFACGVISAANGLGYTVAPTRSRTARAVLRTTTGASAGVVRFSPVGTDRVHVSVEAGGLTPGFHGFHVHAVGQCDPATATPFTSAGGHLGSMSADHGAHDGDMPALFATADGRARAEFDTDAYTLAQVLDSDGGALVVHAAADNLANIPTRYAFTNTDGSTGTGPDAATKATGDSGGRVACGVVVVPPAPASITASLDFPVVTAGNTPVLLCTVKDAAGAGAPDVELRLFAKQWGEDTYRDVGSGFTDESGAASFVLRPDRQTAYVVQAGTLSARALVQVNARVTLSAPMPGSMPSSMSPTRFTGTLTPAYVGAPVGLGVFTGSGASRRYTYLGQTVSTAGGQFEISRTLPAGDATYVVYVSARQGTRRGSTSLLLRVQ